MGTSRNDRSPSTPPWKIALAVLGTPDVPPDRQCTEIWRAVAADRGEKMLRDFSHPSLAEACRLASARISPQEAVARFDAITSEATAPGFTFDMGRRAIARCAAESSGSSGFVSELFSEAVSYYASRDLPSYVGATGRIQNSTESIQLKELLRRVTKIKVESAGSPRSATREWRGYIARVLRALQGGAQ